MLIGWKSQHEKSRNVTNTCVVPAVGPSYIRLLDITIRSMYCTVANTVSPDIQNSTVITLPQGRALDSKVGVIRKRHASTGKPHLVNIHTYFQYTTFHKNSVAQIWIISATSVRTTLAVESTTRM